MNPNLEDTGFLLETERRVLQSMGNEPYNHLLADSEH